MSYKYFGFCVFVEGERTFTEKLFLSIVIVGIRQLATKAAELN